MEEPDDKIIDMYRGLRRIEESFKVTKSELEARPVYVWKREHIEAHFLTCFVALTIAKILEMKLGRKNTVSENFWSPFPWQNAVWFSRIIICLTIMMRY